MLWKSVENQSSGEWRSLQSVALLMVTNNLFMPFFAALLMLWVLFRRGWRSLATPINIGYFWLALWMILTTITAWDSGTAAVGLANFLPFFLLAATTSYIVRTPAQFIHLLWLFVLGSILVGGFGILQALVDRPDLRFPKAIFDSYIIPMGFSRDRRIQSLFGHFNEAAIYLLMILPISLHLAIGKVKSISKLQRIIAAIALCLGLAVLIMTGSRNAWGLALIGAVIMAIYYRQWQIVSGFTLITLALVWAVFGSRFGLGGEWLRSLLPQGFVLRLASTLDPSLGDYASTADRLNAWQFATTLISQHPLQGWGLRNFTNVAAGMNFDLRGLPHEHNLFLAIAVGAGIPALLGLIGIIVWIFKRSFNMVIIKQTEGMIVIAAIAIALCLMSGWLDIAIYEPRVSMLFWYLLGSMDGLCSKAIVWQDK
jgi:O-antigen ligase